MAGFRRMNSTPVWVSGNGRVPVSRSAPCGMVKPAVCERGTGGGEILDIGNGNRSEIAAGVFGFLPKRNLMIHSWESKVSMLE